MNITIPKSLASRLRDKPNKSAYIAKALEEKLAAEDRVKREAELAAAYRAAAGEEGSLLADWDAAAGDGQ